MKEFCDTLTDDVHNILSDTENKLWPYIGHRYEQLLLFVYSHPLLEFEF